MSDHHQIEHKKLLADVHQAVGKMLGAINDRILALESLHPTLAAAAPAPSAAPPGSAPTASRGAPSTSQPAVNAGQPRPAGGVGASDPLSVLRTVSAQIAGKTRDGNRLTDVDIRGYRDTCKSALTALAQGTSQYPAGYATATVPQLIAYQLAVRDAYTTAVGLLLDAARARDPYAPQLQIA